MNLNDIVLFFSSHIPNQTGQIPGSVSCEISFLVEKLKLSRRHIRIIERMLVRRVDEMREGKYLLLIRGLNYVAVDGLLAELGCFKLYRSVKQMIKMANQELRGDRSGSPTEYFQSLRA